MRKLKTNDIDGFLWWASWFKPDISYNNWELMVYSIQKRQEKVIDYFFSKSVNDIYGFHRVNRCFIRMSENKFVIKEYDTMHVLFIKDDFLISMRNDITYEYINGITRVIHEQTPYNKYTMMKAERLVERCMVEDDADMLRFLIYKGVILHNYLNKDKRGTSFNNVCICKLMKDLAKDKEYINIVHLYLLDRAYHGDIVAITTIIDNTWQWNINNWCLWKDKMYLYYFYRQLMMNAGSNGHIDIVQYIVNQLNEKQREILFSEPVMYNYSNVSVEQKEYLKHYGYGDKEVCETLYFVKDFISSNILNNNIIIVFKQWLDAGWNIHAYEEYALRTAVFNGNIVVTELLLKHGANPNVNPRIEPRMYKKFVNYNDFYNTYHTYDRYRLSISYYKDVFEYCENEDWFLLNICVQMVYSRQSSGSRWDKITYIKIAKLLIEYGAYVPMTHPFRYIKDLIQLYALFDNNCIPNTIKMDIIKLYIKMYYMEQKEDIYTIFNIPLYDRNSKLNTIVHKAQLLGHNNSYCRSKETYGEIYITSPMWSLD